MNIFRRPSGEKESQSQTLDANQFLRAFEQFVKARTWKESQRIVEQQPILLHPDGDDLLRQLAAAQPDPQPSQVVEEHRALLRRCREVGIPRAFAGKMLPPEALAQAEAAGLTPEQVIEAQQAASQMPPELMEIFAELAASGAEIRSPEDLEDPQAHKRLIEVMNTGAAQDTIPLRSPADRDHVSGDNNADEVQDTIPLRSPAASQIASAPVLRYTDIACPRRVWIETPRISVVVRLTVQRPASSAAVQELTLDPTQTVRVSLQAPGFIVLGPPVQPIAIAADADSAPVVFDLRPEKVGHTSLTFDFFQRNEPVGTAVVAVEITAYDVIEGAAPAPARPLAFGKNVAPPDMVLHIAVEESPPPLVFSLSRDGGAWWKTFPPVRIRQLPESYAAGLYDSIASLVGFADPVVQEVLGKRLSIPPDDVDRSVRKLGWNLWKDLIPDDLKALYAAERSDWADKTLLIRSDEPHLPWELVRPYDEGGRWSDEFPWCCTLNMTRWLRKDGRGNGNEAPPGRLSLRRLAVLAPTYSLLKNLSGAQMEQDVVRGMIVQRGLEDVSPPQPAWGSVIDLLERGGYDWVHAAAHGNFYAADPEADSALWLQHDRALTPDAIVGPEIESHLRTQRPAFFFNACQVGRQSWTLMRIGGWANRLIGAGAGLFVGPLWEVRDGTALTFASTFYRALFDGETVAKAARSARLAARSAGDPTWLAYSIYAHPNAWVAPGA